MNVDLDDFLVRAVELPGDVYARLLALNTRSAMLAAICRRAISYVPAAQKRALEDDLDEVMREIRILCSHPPKNQDR